MREHFLGPVMYLAAVDPLNAHWSPYLVYDGQQRLTTVTLILKALARHLKDDTAPDGFEPVQIRSEYLLNAYRKGDQQYRLLLKPGDTETLLALKRRLLLTLNMRFDELKDPRGLAADITNLGLWGNGDVQVELDNERQITYAMELVRQAFAAKQPGAEAGDLGDTPVS